MLTALLNLSAVCTLNLLLFLCRFTHSFYINLHKFRIFASADNSIMKVFCSLFDYEAAVKLRLSGRTATLIAFVEVKANTGNTKSTKTVLKKL